MLSNFINDIVTTKKKYPIPVDQINNMINKILNKKNSNKFAQRSHSLIPDLIKKKNVSSLEQQYKDSLNILNLLRKEIENNNIKNKFDANLISSKNMRDVKNLNNEFFDNTLMKKKFFIIHV